MEGVLSFLERVALVGIGIFALYRCYQIGDDGLLRRPAAGWTVRAVLILLAAVCFFAVARLVGSY